MTFMRYAAFLLLSLPITFLASRASAAPRGQVELEIAGGTQPGAALSFQEWNRALSAAGVQKFSLRGGQAGDKPGIETGGTDQLPLYKVTAVLTQSDVLVVPGARFRRSECKRLAEWLDDLAKRGPPEKREKASAFGLTGSQLEKVNADLAKTVDFSTKGMSRANAVNKIAGQLELKLTVEGRLSEGAEGDNDKIEEELSGLSSGTALACILRPIGFCMVPRESSDTLAYTVKKAELGKEVWPIGWPAESVQKVLPGIYEFHNVNVASVAATKVLGAIGKQLDVPVLYDHNAMARYGIELEKAVLSHPQARTTYSIALRKMLAKVGLKFELRVDEAGKPFLWVSTLKSV
jgi:hypothetical protein